MNILYFSGIKLPSRSPQSVHVMKMAQAFYNAGHNVTLYAKSALNAKAEDIFRIYDIDTPFKIDLTSHTRFPLLPNMRRLIGLRAAKEDKNKAQHPDLIYGHDVFALAFHAYYAKNVIFEMHELPALPAHKLAFAKLLKQKNLKGIITASDTLKSDLLKAYPEIYPEQIFVAHDGADLINNIQEDMKSSNSLKGKNILNVGYAGSLTPGKGLALISRIAKIRPDYDFHILGGKRSRIKLLQEQNKCNNIHFYGHRDHAEIPSYLNLFDVCVAPYQHRALIKTGRNTSRWISPMKIFEYMAAKKPIICSNLPVINDILKHDYDALLLPPSDEEKWAETLDLLHSSSDLCETLAVNAYKSLKENYTWDKRIHAIISFCKISSADHQRVSQAS